jgi:rRNA-processing protein FCF1
MKIVLPDTNIILWTFQGGPDFRESIKEIAPAHEINIPNCVINELKKINSKESLAALKFCENITTLDVGDGYADDLLIEYAKKGYLIATNDKEILKTLKECKINALRTRGKKALIMTEVL